MTDLPPNIKLKFPKPAEAKLVLPRRTLRDRLAEPVHMPTAVEAHKAIEAFISASRTPFGGALSVTDSQLATLERTLRQVEARLAQRERDFEDIVAKLAERERELWEAEALIEAKERLLEAARATPAVPSGTPTSEEREALEALKTQVEQQEAALREARAALHEREEFLEQSEASLLAKMQREQERETELEQLADELRRREQRLITAEGGRPPAEPEVPKESPM